MPNVGAERIYYIDEGHHLRAVHAVMQADGRYHPTGVEERVSFPIVQAAIAKAEGRPDLHPTELGYSELGAGAVRKKIKKVAKKIAKSKVIKKIAKVGKVVGSVAASAVPGGAALVAAGTIAAKTGKAIKKSKNAKKAKAHPAAVASASAKLRAKVAPTSAVAQTPDAALLREQRLDEAAKALATVPPEQHDDAINTIANRLDSYKVITPNGNTVWVSPESIGLPATASTVPDNDQDDADAGAA